MQNGDSIEITTFDVAKGDCHAIITPSGRLVVIDLGECDYCQPLEAIRQSGRARIDLLLITHQHADHIAGIPSLDGMPVGILHRPNRVPAELTAQLGDDLKTAWQNFDARFTAPVVSSDKFYDPGSPSFDGMSIQFFGGRSDSSNLNNYSIVAVVEFDGFKLLFPGDLEAPGWEKLLADSLFVAAITGTRILYAAHHGREAGWYAPLFEVISPDLTIISDGDEQDTSYTDGYCGVTNGHQVRTRPTTPVEVLLPNSKECKAISTRNNGKIVTRVERPALPVILSEPICTVTVDHH